MDWGRKTLVALAGLVTLATGGCAYGGYGSAGLGYGYDAPFYGDGYGGYGYGGYGDPYFAGGYWGPSYGWFDNGYYPGSGFYVYDRGGRRSRWSDSQRRHWEARRANGNDGRGGLRFGDNRPGRPTRVGPGGDRPGFARRDFGRRGNWQPVAPLAVEAGAAQAGTPAPATAGRGYQFRQGRQSYRGADGSFTPRAVNRGDGAAASRRFGGPRSGGGSRGFGGGRAQRPR